MRWSFFPASKRTETRLCAVSVLADIATPEAAEILKRGTKVLNRTIRLACQLKLRETALRSESSKEEREKQGTN
jgi:ferredoxin